MDVEGKIPRALEALGPIAGAGVVLVGAADELRIRQLADLGARVTAVSEADVAQLPAGGADVIAGFWSWFRDDLPGTLRVAERAIHDGGRVLVLHDYGRDDVSRFHAPDRPEYTAWSRRDGWFLQTGFRVRVIHCWWTFESVAEARAFLDDAFGASASAVGAGLTRPRLSHNVAIYHRTKGGGPEGPS